MSAETKLACTIIVPSVQIGELICGDGHKISLTKAEVETLNAIDPERPAIRIDGI